MGASGPLGIAPSLFPNLPYDPLRDLTPVALVATVPQLFIVRADSPIRSIADLIAAAQAKPGEVFYASSGNGTTQHLNVEMFGAMAGVRLAHVPYRGSAPALADLLGGRVAFMSDTLAAAGPQIREGKVRAIGVTSAARSPFFPDVPTIAEQGVAGYESVGWISVVGPRALPAEIAQAAAQAIGAVVAEPEFAARLRSQSFTPDFRPTDRFRAFLAEEITKWREVVRVSGAKVDP
jgi:tripartite-type tricarboxylate transporter receptor subunit TctC